MTHSGVNKENDAFPVPAAKELLQLLNALTDTTVITKPGYNLFIFRFILMPSSFFAAVFAHDFNFEFFFFFFIFEGDI